MMKWYCCQVSGAGSNSFTFGDLVNPCTFSLSLLIFIGNRLAMVISIPDNHPRFRFSPYEALINGGPGPPATLVREPGQDRKVAATANDVCAGMWLGLPPI